MTNQKYVTGRRFKAKVCEEPAKGTIQPMSDPKGHWFLLKETGESWYIGTGSPDELLHHQVTDLILLPDTEEPVKGDAVEVSDDGEQWEITDRKRIYTGWKTKNEMFLVDTNGGLSLWPHIRIAKPTPTERELAEKEAREFCDKNDLLYPSYQFDGIVEYILKTQKS